MNESQSAPSPRRPLGVFAVIDRRDGNRPAHWLRIGNAFANRDGSLTLLLDAIPLSTQRLQVRESRPHDEPRVPGPAPTGRVPAAAPPEARP